MRGTISIVLDGASFQDTERCRQIIHKLFESNVFGVKNGKAILSFDSGGILADIEISMKTYNRKFENEPKLELKSFDQFKIETTPDHSTVAKSI
mgnify:FL=1